MTLAVAILALTSSGAGGGNRTHVTCLGSKSSTIELHPRCYLASYHVESVVERAKHGPAVHQGHRFVSLVCSLARVIHSVL